jgi:group II intron reverse transcriptase/maturase/CRISPR-associated endonuclease Cas1
MKNSIFDKKFEEIFTPERIAFEAAKIEATNVDYENFFDFAPHKRLYIPKNDRELRQINVPDTKAKIIQRILVDELSHFFRFSDRNYAYQKGKSPLKAINRVKNLLHHANFVYKADIDDFFDSINHDLLLLTLQRHIADKKILYLIAIFLKNGSLFKGRWHDKLEGVYQGDVISPFLANFYLNQFDEAMEGTEYVRFADDMIFFAKNQKELDLIRTKAAKELERLSLRFDPAKSYVRHISQTFEFLGVRFDHQRKLYSIDNDRLMKKISEISRRTKNTDLPSTIEILNDHVKGFGNYYLKVVNDTKQFELLQQREDEILVKKIVQAKQKRSITRKRDFLRLLQQVRTYLPIEDYHIKIVRRAYEELRLQNPIESAAKKIAAQKLAYLKTNLKSSELIISSTGAYLTYSQGSVKLKLPGKSPKKIGIERIHRIIITNTRTSLSTYLLYQCAKRGIDVDFIHQETPFAQIIYTKHPTHSLYQRQLKFLSSPLAHIYAQNLLLAKAKNQLNLLKYYNHRRGDLEGEIERIEFLVPKIKKAKRNKELMGLEGQISQIYWNGFKKIALTPSFVRHHQNAPDPINQALNYGYAILYHKLQSALVKEGLNIYYSFLHATDHTKPTLVFDMVEPFRQPVVDREVLSILSRGQKLTSKNGRLSEASKKLLIQNIQERLAIPTKSRYGKTSLLNIIFYEANELKRYIIAQKPKKFFVAKY